VSASSCFLHYTSNNVECQCKILGKGGEGEDEIAPLTFTLCVFLDNGTWLKEQFVLADMGGKGRLNEREVFNVLQQLNADIPESIVKQKFKVRTLNKKTLSQ